MVNENNKIEPGELKILDAVLPPMVAGEYVLGAEQTVVLNDGNAPIKKQELIFHVSAPRFSIGDAVDSVYPPKDPPASYSKTLPNIVFNRKTLPWERSIDTTGTVDKATPWITLILLDEDEMKDNNIVMKNVILKEIFEVPTGVIRPKIESEPWDKEEMKQPVTNDTPRYNVIDVPCLLLNEIVPYEDELKYLAHARQVDTANKEAPDSNDKGWYSVVVGNRLPAHNKKNFVFAVSLEGHKENIIAKNLTDVKNKDNSVRLVVLHSWSFTDQGQDFESMVQNIDARTSILKMDINDTTITDKSVKKAFSFGYTAIDHQLRNGANSISWYRGPLVPVYIRKPAKRNLDNADAALMFDEQTSMFDISYASAWQLGWLLALKNTAYMNAVNSWKKNFVRDVRLAKARELIKENIDDKFSFVQHNKNTAGKNETGNQKLLFTDAVNKAETDEFLNSLLAELWNKNLNNEG